MSTESKGLHFTAEEEREFAELTAIRPKGFGQRLSVFFDRIMNSIWTFFVLIGYSLLGAVFPHLLTPLLFWSNSYQLSSLPVVALSAALGTRILMRLIFRIYLNQGKRDEQRALEMAEIKDMVTELHEIAKMEQQRAVSAEERESVQREILQRVEHLEAILE